LGLLRLRSIFLAGIVDILPPAIGYSRLAARLKRLRRTAQLYVGKPPILKGIEELYGGLWCLPFRPISLAAACRNDQANRARSCAEPVFGSHIPRALLSGFGLDRVPRRSKPTLLCAMMATPITTIAIPAKWAATACCEEALLMLAFAGLEQLLWNRVHTPR